MFQITTASTNVELRKEFVKGNPSPITHAHATSCEYSRHSFADLSEFVSLLKDLVEQPHSALIQGIPKVARGPRNTENFEDMPSQLFVVDIDGANLTGSVEETIEEILPCLRGVSYIFMYSQSSGIKSGLRVRVFFLTERALSLPEQQFYVRHYNDIRKFTSTDARPKIDASIYSLGHLIFTARPKLIGIDDPHPERVWHVVRERVFVDLPDMPKMKEFTFDYGNAQFDSLPKLHGNWGGYALEGMDRSKQAIRAIGQLRAYMGEDDWKNVDMAEANWHQMLREAGASQIDFLLYGNFLRERKRHAKVFKNQKTILALTNEGCSMPIEEAGQLITSTICNVIIHNQTGMHVAEGTMGIGKTRAIINAIKKHERLASGLNVSSKKFYVLLPTRSMVDQFVGDAIRDGIDAVAYYGRAQKIDDTPMCHKYEAANELGKFNAQIPQYICKSKDGRSVCNYYDLCAWHSQLHDAAKATVCVMTHDVLAQINFIREYAKKLGDSDSSEVVIIDEASFVSSQLSHESISVAEFLDERGYPSHLFDYAGKLVQLLRSGITFRGLSEAGLTTDVLTQLIEHCAAKMRGDIHVSPDMSPDESLRAINLYDRTWYNHECVWSAIQSCLSTNSLNRIRFNNGFIEIHERRPIKFIRFKENECKTPDIPVLLLSGTVKRSVIEQFFTIASWTAVEVDPHPETKIIQSTFSGSKTELLYETMSKHEDDAQLHERMLQRARRLRAMLRLFMRKMSIITYKLEADELRKEALEMNIEATIGHFGAIEGLNCMEGTDLVISGRPLPSPKDMEDMACAIFCDDPTPIRRLVAAWYPSRPVARRHHNSFAYAEYHPDERVNDCVYITCVGEVMQAVARARYIRHPVKIYILSELPLPLHVDEVLTPTELLYDFFQVSSEKFRFASQNTLMRQFPEAFKDGRDASRFIYETVRPWVQERLAYLFKVRIPGTRGPKSTVYVDGLENQTAISVALGNTPIELSEDAPAAKHNEAAMHLREYQEMMQRHPIESDIISNEMGEAEPDFYNMFKDVSDFADLYILPKKQRNKWPWSR